MTELERACPVCGIEGTLDYDQNVSVELEDPDKEDNREIKEGGVTTCSNCWSEFHIPNDHMHGFIMGE